MADKWPLANGNWSNAANWNGGTKPVAGDDVYADGRTLNVDESFDVATLRSTARSGGTVGGNFVFNTAGVTGTVTSSSPLIPGATNLIQVTATTGTVTISLGGNVAPRAVISDVLILHSGNCNFNLTGTNFNGSTGGSNTTCINKTSAGTITITGNLNGPSATNGSVLLSNNGPTVVIGNVVGGAGGSGGNRGINQSAGTLTITGNVTGGQTVTNNNGIQFLGTAFNITGDMLGGSGAWALSTTSQVNNIVGNLTAGNLSAIGSSSPIQVSVTGTVTASSLANAILINNATANVYLNGNMVNNNGKVAIFAPIVWLDKNNTTSAAFFTSGGGNRTLYSADTFPNMPLESDTRENVVFGPGNSLRGTLKMPTTANMRNGVVFDNGSVGTALFTTSQLLTEINASSDAVAVRMKNAATPEILGEIMEAYKK